jgi:DNA-binding transcriptional MerR regulator
MANFLTSESARVLRGIAAILEPVREAEGEPAPAREFRIDDLAREAGVSVRNVRVYQDRGLLPPPRREGRSGFYNESHLARLNLINRMLDRGYTFATISELLTAAQYGMRVEEVLDVDRLAPERPDIASGEQLTSAKLSGLFGDEEFDANLAKALRSGLLKRDGQAYRVANPRLLEATELLLDAGVPLSNILDNAGVVRKDLRDVADRFVKLVADRYFPADGVASDLDEEAVAGLTELINKGRALVHDVVHSILVDVMDESISAALERAAEQLAVAAQGEAK